MKWTVQTGKAKRSGPGIVRSCVTGDIVPSHHPPKPKACSQAWPPLQSALPQAVSPAVQQELGGVMKTTSKTRASAAEPWQSSGLLATELTHSASAMLPCSHTLARDTAVLALGMGQSSTSGKVQLCTSAASTSEETGFPFSPFTLAFDTLGHVHVCYTTPAVQYCCLGLTKAQLKDA